MMNRTSKDELWARLVKVLMFIFISSCLTKLCVASYLSTSKTLYVTLKKRDYEGIYCQSMGMSCKIENMRKCVQLIVIKFC